MEKLNIISPDDNRLSYSAKGVLATMLNNPKTDYRTAEELCTYFESDSLKSIRLALSELVKTEYVIFIDGKYAVNKPRLLEMKMI